MTTAGIADGVDGRSAATRPLPNWLLYLIAAVGVAVLDSIRSVSSAGA